jgi:hypothetical protein
MRDFKQLAALTREELAFLSRKEAPTGTAHGIGVGVDAAEYETIATDPTATAAAIIAAAAKARGGGDTLAPKLGAAAEAILRAGRQRRAEG